MESRLEFDLVQQSPMIHFQYDEEGAALRATDVKPRLDRFLIEEYKKENNGKNVPENWLQPGQPGALKYRMRIAAHTRKRISVKAVGLQGLFFANMGRERENRESLRYFENPTKLDFVCFIKELRRYISKKIKLFFFLNNFGTRQNKGFGSFIVKDSGTYAGNELLHYYGEKPIYKIEYPGRNDITSEEILKDINELYKTLKGGINYRGIYIKSYLIKYFLNKGIGSEKRWMKEKHIAPIVGGRNAENPVNNYKYVRALLGTGEIQAWFTDRRNTNKKETITVSSDPRDRMPSPIVFKIIGKTLYILPNEPSEDIYGKSYVFHNECKESNANYPDESQRTLKVPDKTEFDMDELMKGFVGEFESIKDGLKNIEGRKPKFVKYSLKLIRVAKEVKL